MPLLVFDPSKRFLRSRPELQRQETPVFPKRWVLKHHEWGLETSEMYRVSLSFRQAEDDRLVVMAAARPTQSSTSSEVAIETIYDHEDSFLRLLIFAELDEAATRRLVVAVILSIANPAEVGEWIPIEINGEQRELLALNLPEAARDAEPLVYEESSLSERIEPFFVFHEKAADFYDFLMNAPTPFVMLSGPDHIVTFINPAYVLILGRTSRDEILGLPLREAIPEVEGQLCLSLLDRAYETGLPQIRQRLSSLVRRQKSGQLEEVYFDIVYQPVRDSSGKVSGVMAQASDVTERVLDRQVSEDRERKLYRLWAELETLYEVAPVGLAVIEARDLKLLRLNALQAGLFGQSREELAGKLLPELASMPNSLLGLLERAARGEVIVDTVVEIDAGDAFESHQLWSVSVRPSLNTYGVVETLTLISSDIRANAAKANRFVEQLSA